LVRVRPITGTELISRLAAVGLREDFEAGELYCASCGAQLNNDNVGFLTYDDSRKGFRKGLASCVNEECFDELVGGKIPNVFVRPNSARQSCF
jgi:hypothetical protein